MLIVVAGLAGCQFDNDEPTGLRATPDDQGPRVIFDLEAKPLPEIPFPNDLATRVDTTSPTGRRLNISQISDTALESEIRALADDLDGWGTFSSITVSFDELIDVKGLWERHQDRELTNDGVLLINIDPKSPEFGQVAQLDVGRGHYPVTLRERSNYFPNDYRAGESNLLYETVDEDLNHDGVLQPEEDTDFDGVLDRPNLFPGGTNTVDDLMTFYELETNTLIVRPVVPLREQTRYAVVLTRNITAYDRNPDDGVPPSPIRSPFAYVHHTRQKDDLAPLREVLPALGFTMDDVAFSWSFTTQTITADLVAVRKGLYGHGPFGWLDAAYEPRIARLDVFRSERSKNPRHIMWASDLDTILDFLLQSAFDELTPASAAAAKESIKAVDYFVSGSFDSPNFLVDDDGHASADNPADDDEVWRLDAIAGTAVQAPARVTFLCAIPRREMLEDPKGVFPVVMYGHGHMSARLEMLGFVGLHARGGMATCALDAYGHGLEIPAAIAKNGLLKTLMESLDLTYGLQAMSMGRARDLNNDGAVDSGVDYWTANTFHTRDAVRQTVVDWLVFIRMLRRLDGSRRWNLEDEEGAIVLDGMAGDFDGDGLQDIGGPNSEVYMWGQSLGGFVSAVAAAVEPFAIASAPVAAGGGLSDVSMRTALGGVIAPVWLRIMGPLVLASPEGEEGRVALTWMAINGARGRQMPIATLGPDELAPGDRIVLHNLRSGETDDVLLTDQRRARLAVAADAMPGSARRAILDLDPTSESFVPYLIEGDEAVERGFADPFEIRIYSGEDGALKRVVATFDLEEPAVWQGQAFAPGSGLVNPAEGLGLKRQTPQLRRFFGIGQTILDPADPANYAKRYLDPIDFSDVEPDSDGLRRVLLISTLGDMWVPVNTGIAVARAAGYVGLEVDPRYGKSVDELLVDNFVLEGIPELERFGPEVGYNLFDPDDLDNDTDGYAAPSPAEPVRSTLLLKDGSEVGARFPYMVPDGEHGFFVESPDKAFDIDTFMGNQVTYYFKTRGHDIIDDPCLEDMSCPFFKALPGPK